MQQRDFLSSWQDVQKPVTSSQISLSAYCFGDFCLCRNGMPVAEREWVRKRARSLCAYMIYRQGQFLSKELLIELFWPDQEFEAAQRYLAVLLHLLRRILEPDLQRGDQSRYLAHEHEGYRFNAEGLLWSDVQVFENAYERAVAHHRAGETCRAAQAFLQVTQLYRGAYLSNALYEEWCNLPRRRFLDMYINALLHLADYSFKQGDYRQCLDWLNRGLGEDNCHEELHQRRIQVYQQLALYNEAMRCYHDYCQVMAGELDSLPSPQMRYVYEQLRVACSSPRENIYRT